MYYSQRWTTNNLLHGTRHQQRSQSRTAHSRGQLTGHPPRYHPSSCGQRGSSLACNPTMGSRAGWCHQVCVVGPRRTPSQGRPHTAGTGATTNPSAHQGSEGSGYTKMGDALRGRSIVVTGASSGIGREVALLFSRAGARLLLLGQRESELEHTQAACAQPAHQTSQSIDIRDLEGLQRALASWAQHDGISGLVHCAGINAPVGIRETSATSWAEVIDINLTGTFNICKAVVENISTDGERSLVIVSSVQARTASRSAQYAASNAGQEGLVRSLSRQLGPEGIRVNAIAPGGIETDRWPGRASRVPARPRGAGPR